MGEAVDVRSLDYRASVAAEVAITEVVGKDQDYIRLSTRESRHCFDYFACRLYVLFGVNENSGFERES